MDQLIAELGSKQRELGSADLQRAHQSDEIEFTDTLFTAVESELNLAPEADSPLGKRAENVVVRYREMISDLRQSDQDRRQRYDAFISSLRQACGGQHDSNELLSTAENKIARAVSDAMTGQDQAMREIARLRSEIAEFSTHIHQLENEVHERDQRLAKYEFSETPDAHEDERLTYYRAAFTEWENGRDPREYMEQARELERVLAISDVEYQQVMQHLGRRLESLVKTLVELRRFMALCDDPKRFRPRLLGSSPYKLKKPFPAKCRHVVMRPVMYKNM